MASELPASLASLGSHRWDDAAMRSTLEPDVYARFIAACESGEDLSKDDKNALAQALYVWATGLGCVNFCHWFSPLRVGGCGLGGGNGQKYDAFIDLDYGSPLNLKPIVTGFNGTKLFVGETDGSSFPNGGLRATHRAAAFTTWDRTSPPWIKDDILFIPAAFISHFGAALDEKTPLLRSQDAINTQGVRLLRLLGDSATTQVVSNVGWEQEFFVVSRDTYLRRPDLRASGRTLIGNVPTRNQQTELNYFAAVPIKIKNFMTEVQTEMWKLGCAMVVMHNEVAPGQHEVSPIFSLTNVAADQNVVSLEVMNDIATKHGLVVLFHEKPFQGINGSGKHNNWGLNTNTGKNLYVPGKTPEAQQSFMAFTAALSYGLHVHGDIVRCSVATANNDHRLGAQEAPPAIISLYTGIRMEEQIRSIIAGGPLEGYGAGSNSVSAHTTSVCDIGVGMEDRNRTAPFPFCGNRWEFRAVGSSQHIAFPMAMVNTAVADGIRVLCEKIEGGLTVRDAVAEMFSEHIAVIFNGNGYSDEWRQEAAQRGLLNLENTVQAVETFASDKNKQLFSSMGVYTVEEVDARQELMFENYTKQLEIEAATLVQMMDTGLIPAMAADLALYSGAPAIFRGNRLELYTSVIDETSRLREILAAAPNDHGHEGSRYMCEVVKPQMSTLRAAADAAELKIAHSLYPYPKYEELLYDHHLA